MDCLIRDMTLEDLDRVAEIEKASFTTAWSKDQFAFEISSNPLSKYIVAEKDSELLGYAGIWIIIDEAHVTTICVDEKYRGLDIGDRLMARLIEISQEMDMEAITLEVRRSNDVAKNLYEKYGFISAGIRPNYYTDTKEDAIIMWKELKDR